MDIYLEQYCKTVNVEALLTAGDGQDDDLPGRDPLSERVGLDLREPEGWSATTFDTDTLDKITELVKNLQDEHCACWRRRWPHHGGQDLHGRGQAFLRRGAAGHGGGAQVRRRAGRLVADDLWPLPTYQEMLFIK